MLTPISQDTKVVISRVHPTTYCLRRVNDDSQLPEYEQIQKSIFRKKIEDMPIDQYNAYLEYDLYSTAFSKYRKGRVFETVVRVYLLQGGYKTIYLIDTRGTINILNAIYKEIPESEINNIAVVALIDITDKFTFSAIKDMYSIYMQYRVKEHDRGKAERFRSSLSEQGKKILDFMISLVKEPGSNSIDNTTLGDLLPEEIIDLEEIPINEEY